VNNHSPIQLGEGTSFIETFNFT